MIIELKQLDSRIPKWDFTCFKERNCPICNTHNEVYMQTKKDKMGHVLNLKK